VTRSASGIFGIDLGVTHSAVGYIDEAGQAAVTRNQAGEGTTPSVVFFETADNVIVGQVARESAGIYPDQVVSHIKWEMGDREWRRTFFGVDYTPPSIAALILGALAKDAEADTGRKVTDVVITVPAYFGLLEKDATRQAGEIAGLNVIGIVPEPVAAALHYGLAGSADGTTVLVYDLGGATFDVSLVKMTGNSAEVLAFGGDHRLGGVNWDARLLDHMLDQVVEQTGDESIRDDEAMLLELYIVAERTKKALSSAETKAQVIRYAGTAARINVTREHFEQMTADLLDDTMRITRRTLAEAEGKHPGIRQEISEVLLVGGSSQMPAISAVLRTGFGWKSQFADPDLAIAKGAAIYGAGLKGQVAMSTFRADLKGQGTKSTYGSDLKDSAATPMKQDFDEAQYVRDFIKPLRGARRLPDDLLARYAITLPASSTEIAARVYAVRKYWNKTYAGPSAQVARMCRAADERLRAEHGQAMFTRAWWEQRQSEQQAAAEASMMALAEQLRLAYGQLGVVTAGILGQFAARIGLTEAQAARAAERAGLRTVSGVTLPDTEPISMFAALLKSMSECGAASVPELVHPGAGPFSLVERYVCRADPAKRLDAVAVEAQSAELDKRGVSATDDARRGALKILRKALNNGVDLRDVALYHLVMIARDFILLSPGMAVAELQKTGLERDDAAVITVLLSDHLSVWRQIRSRPAESSRAFSLNSREDFGSALAELRLRSGLTSQQISVRTDIPVSSLADYFAGRRLPAKPATLRDILVACGVADDNEIGTWLSALDGLRAIPLEEDSPISAEDKDPPGLLFRFYVPSGRLYASEADRLLSMFRDWLGRVRGNSIRQAGYETDAGKFYEFYGDQRLADLNLSREFSDFTGFLTLCAENQMAAADQLVNAGLDPVIGTDLAARYGKEARRLGVDLRYEREQRISAIRHSLESELLDQEVDAHVVGQIASLVEALVPDPTARSPLALFGADRPTNPVPVTFNINQQIINAAESHVIQNVQGTIGFGPQAKDLLDLIQRFGEEQAVALQAAVYELEDPDARQADRLRAKRRIKEFLGRLGGSVQDIMIGVLEKYLETKIGI
jgi:actin-like ATPase involved in cell morphogenesis/transcriptional regulator with XRE-family HTH domain